MTQRFLISIASERKITMGHMKATRASGSDYERTGLVWEGRGMSRRQEIWFHGTNYRSALKIERTGFRRGTWFARHMEDAVAFGGDCIFWVKVRFDKVPLKWQVCCSNTIPASAIQQRMDIVRKAAASTRGQP